MLESSIKIRTMQVDVSEHDISEAAMQVTLTDNRVPLRGDLLIQSLPK